LRPFLDTNILVYAVSDDPRRSRAQELLAEGGTISVQVLNEFANVLLVKLRKPWPDIEAAIEDICAVAELARSLTLATHRSARALARDHNVSRVGERLQRPAQRGFAARSLDRRAGDPEPVRVAVAGVCRPLERLINVLSHAD
jgi:predicted nucleic acid-binding protein